MTAEVADLEELGQRLRALKAELDQLVALPPPPASPQAARSTVLADTCRRIEILCRDIQAAPRPAARTLKSGLSELLAAFDSLERKLAAARPPDWPSAGPPVGDDPADR